VLKNGVIKLYIRASLRSNYFTLNNLVSTVNPKVRPRFKTSHPTCYFEIFIAYSACVFHEFHHMIFNLTRIKNLAYVFKYFRVVDRKMGNILKPCPDEACGSQLRGAIAGCNCGVQLRGASADEESIPDGAR
jgi:hypothetical protein